MKESAQSGYLFLFDDFWWVLPLVIFAALLLSSFIYRKEAECTEKGILRHDTAARISHWFNAAGILLLIATGMLLGFDDVLPRRVAYTETVSLVFNLHFLGAVLFLFGGFFWVGNMFLSPQRFEEHVPYKGSIKDAVLHYLHLAGLVKKEGAPTGKYEASERLAFVPLTLLALIMGLTGLVKLSARVWHTPDSLLAVSSFIHDWGMILLAVLLVFHIVLAAVVPWAWPLLGSMITGYIDEAFVRSHHKGWYRELVKKGKCKDGE